MVLNRCPDEKQAMLGWERFKKTSLQFLGTHPELVGWVPADEAVGRSVQLRKPVSLSEPASQAAQAIAKVAAWTAIETARTPSSFYERAKKALR
jgi:MinD-like ATPase involved in chromosome partitioning or flagellar assembly